MSVIENYFLPHVCDQDSKLQDNPNARSLLAIGYFTAWCSLLYESVNSHYFIARDVARRAIVLSLCAYGTMSVQDCITDSMYKPVLLNADAINMPHLSGAQLHCHAGVVTATNYILSDLNRHQILHKVFFGNNCKNGRFNPFQVCTIPCWRKRKLNERAGHWFFAVIHSEPVLQLCLLYISAGYFKTYAYGESNLLAGYFPQNLQHHAENGP